MGIVLASYSLTDQAYDIIKEKIISKEFPPGMRLIDSQLAKDYGISRTPLRDAIRKLNEDGLVANCPNRGFCVFQPTQKDINEIFEIRLMMDKAAATKLINDILPSNKEAYDTIEGFYTSFQQQNNLDVANESFVKADEDFHDKVVLMIDNERFYNFYVEIRNQTRAFRKKTSGDKERRAKAFMHHEKICRGFLNLDLDQTIKALSEHIELSRNDALADFQ